MSSAQPPSPQINADLVRELIAQQFPQWASLLITPVLPGGWDNRTFRLGDDKLVRLPSALSYIGQVEKEHLWLPKLAAHLSLPIPTPIAKGAATNLFPWPWSVYGWLDGEPVREELIVDQSEFARSLAGFLKELHQADTLDAPEPGPHNFFRGGSLSTYDGETRAALEMLSDSIDTNGALKIWDAAMSTRWERAPVWVHGDIASGNLLMKDGKLYAVIDFGSSAIGDPACDLTIAWTLLGKEGRHAFRSALSLDHDTWARGRGWALWKALITMTNPDKKLHESNKARLTIALLFDEHHQEQNH